MGCRAIEWSSMIGESYNSLKVVGVYEKNFLILECTCGNEVIKNGHNFRNGIAKSCGCQRYRNLEVRLNLACQMSKKNCS